MFEIYIASVRYLVTFEITRIEASLAFCCSGRISPPTPTHQSRRDIVIREPRPPADNAVMLYHPYTLNTNPYTMYTINSVP